TAGDRWEGEGFTGLAWAHHPVAAPDRAARAAVVAGLPGGTAGGPVAALAEAHHPVTAPDRAARAALLAGLPGGTAGESKGRDAGLAGPHHPVAAVDRAVAAEAAPLRGGTEAG